LSKPLISIVIVLFNSNDVLSSTIEALDKSTYDNLELILVDNASEKAISEQAIDCRFPSSVFRRDQNCGFGQGCNFGAEKSKGQLFMFLNPDARPFPEAISIMAQTLLSNEQIAVVGPQLLYDDGAMMPSYRYTPNFRRLLLSRNSPLYGLPGFSRWSEQYIPPPLNEPSEVEVIPATAMMVRRQAFQEVAGFDRGYFLYAEDFDLCVMLRKAGYKIFHQPKALVYHSWGKGSVASRRFLVKQHNRSIYHFFRKHYPRQLMRAAILLFLLSMRSMISIMRSGAVNERH